MTTRHAEPQANRRRLPIAVWLIPAMAIVLPAAGVLYQWATDQTTTLAVTRASDTPLSPEMRSSPSDISASPVRRATDFTPEQPAWARLLATASPFDPSRGQRLVNQGIGATTPACATCHSARNPAPQAFPALDGTSREYMAKQLLDFRTGERASAIMRPIAEALTDGDIASIAGHYAATSARVSPPASDDGPAAVLHFRGDNRRALPACANCHGANGEGGGPLLPRLTGQPAGYIETQLRAFSTQARANDADGVMRSIASRLTDDEIHQLDALYRR